MLLYILLFFLTTLLYKLDTYEIVKNQVVDKLDRYVLYRNYVIHTRNYLVSKYDEIKRLKTFISSSSKSDIETFCKMIKIIMQILYISLIQYLNTTVVKIDNKTYILSYVIEGKLYKMRIICRRGPRRVLQISDENMNNVTDEITPFMGTQFDWNKIEYTPESFNHDSLTFELSDGLEYTFEKNNVIHF